MAPPRNMRRRNALADAAVDLLGAAGSHRLSHRAVDERAGLPAGTAANYFPRREDLLTAAAERVAELALAEMTAADRAAAATGPDVLAGLLGAALHDAATRHRTRYLAAYELGLESTRQPALAAALARLGTGALDAALAEHRALGLPTTPEQVQVLIALYNGTLLTLLIAPPESVTPEATFVLARCLVTGVLGGWPGGAPARSE